MNTRSVSYRSRVEVLTHAIAEMRKVHSKPAFVYMHHVTLYKVHQEGKLHWRADGTLLLDGVVLQQHPHMERDQFLIVADPLA